MNAYPVRLAAGLAWFALCALGEGSPKAKTAEPKAKPAITRKIPPYEVGLNEKPVQLPPQIVDVDGLRNHIDRVNRDLHLAFQRQELAGPHPLYQKALANNTVLAAFLPLEEGSNRAVALPVLRSSW